MGHQIIKQPNGKFAVWSTVVDNFIAWNGTPEEIIEMEVEKVRMNITKDVNRVISELESGGKPYYQFTLSFEDCIDTIRQCHGNSAKTIAIKDLS